MALTVLSVWGHTPRPWGYEVRVDLQESTTGAIYNEVLSFPAAPDQATLDAAVAGALARVEASLLPPPADYRIICEDGTEVLV